jgi:glutamate synthase (NADPH/NADH) small chain
MSTDTRGDVAAQLDEYVAASRALAASRNRIEELAHSRVVTAHRAQLDVLQRHLLADPRVFRDMFIADGMQAVAAEFQQPELSAPFVTTLWQMLLRDDDASRVLMRFIWNIPLGQKRKLIRALDAHLSGRYPMFRGLSVGWPAENSIPPYVRPAAERTDDFDLVNAGYLGYMQIGYTPREVDLFVWLEAIRDKQCTDSPCELGQLIKGHREPKGGCPVQIHIPTVLELIGNGRFREAMELIESVNPLPNVTGRVCPQELQCQGVCAHSKRPIEIGQLEWFLPQRARTFEPDAALTRLSGRPDPWLAAVKPPVAVVGSGPAGLINAYLLAADGYPVTVFESFHELGGVLRYGIPEFRLPNQLIDDVVAKIKALGGRFVTNFVVGRTATLAELADAGFVRTFVGTGAGLPRFLNVPGEHLVNVMSANEFLTRVNLMQAHREGYETPLPQVAGKRVLVIGGGNTAMDAARTARRLGGHVTIVYRRTRAEMPARVEELHHALEEGIELATLRSPVEFLSPVMTAGSWAGSANAPHVVGRAVCDVMELGEPDASGRRSPVATGRTETLPADLVIMALGNDSNPIIRESEPRLATRRGGALELAEGSQQTSVAGVYSGGDAARGGSTAIRAAGDGQAAARQIAKDILLPSAEIKAKVAKARAYTDEATAANTVLATRQLATGIVEQVIHAPMIARAAQAGQFVRVLLEPKGELVPLTLADWDAVQGTITLVIQGLGTTSMLINRMQVGDVYAGIAGPLGRPSVLHSYDAATETVVFTAGGVGLPPVYPIMREHLRLGHHVTLIAGFRSADLLFWVGEGERVDELQALYGDLLDVIHTTNDGSFGEAGFVTGPLERMLLAQQAGAVDRVIREVVTIGPPLMMRAVSDLTRPYGVPTVASLNSIMVDATGMCGACMVPVTIDGALVRKHACIDGPEIDAHLIDWDKFIPRFGQFRPQEKASMVKRGLAAR